MTDTVQPRDLILSDAEVACRMALLAELQVAVEATGVRSVLARRRRLILRYIDGLSEPSGFTDPELRIFTNGRAGVATTDGAGFRLSSGETFAVADVAAATAAICGWQPAESRALPPLATAARRALHPTPDLVMLSSTIGRVW